MKSSQATFFLKLRQMNSTDILDLKTYKLSTFKNLVYNQSKNNIFSIGPTFLKYMNVQILIISFKINFKCSFFLNIKKYWFINL